MSDRLGFDIDYDAPFNAANVRTSLRSLRDAVHENWVTHQDQWSEPFENCLIEVDKWVTEATPERMQKTLPDSSARVTRVLDFNFSSLSMWGAWLFIYCNEDETVSVFITVTDKVLNEIVGSREMFRMEDRWEQIRRERGENPYKTIGPDYGHPEYDAWHEKWIQLEDTPKVWPQNKQCLLHILDKLRSVLPVRKVHLDEPLLGDETDHHT